MSELEKSEKDSELPCCSKSLQSFSSEDDVPIFIDTISNKNGIVNIGIFNFQPATKVEPQPKLMFQVKNPVHTFTGREEFLEDLHNTVQKCKQEGSRVSIISQTSSISGLGGIGKTETVRMYIHKFGHEYDNVVWIDAENPSEAVSQFTTLAFHKLRINVKDHNGHPREFLHILEDVYRKLCQKPKQLLIVFDNAEALDDTDTHALGIWKLLPAQTITNEPPTVLITSRQQYWEDINVITLGLWKIEECIEFIYKRLHLRDTPENKKDSIELAELFDRLPIAIEIAVSVIAEQLRKRKVGGSGVYSINSLIAEYKAGNRKMLLKKTQQNSTQVTMQILLNVSLNKIKAYDEGKLAIKILAYMAYLSPTSIPKEMMNELLHGINEEDRDCALTLLADYSIIQCYDTHFTIHRVFQDIVITVLPDLKLEPFSTNDYSVEYANNEIRVLDELISGLKKYIPRINPTHDDYNETVANIVHSTDYVIQNSMIPKFYYCIKTFANFMETTHCETAIKFYRSLIESDSSSSQTQVQKEKIYASLDSIGGILLKNGKYVQAQETMIELLNIQKQNEFEKSNSATNENENSGLDDLHKFILATQMNIALCLTYQGKYEEALKLYYIVKTEQEKILDSLHPDILKTKSNIAFTLCSQLRHDEAMELLNILEEDVEKELGPLHELTLTNRVNKAQTLSHQGKNDEALELYRSVEKVQEQIVGSLHPNTLMTKLNVAAILIEQGNMEEALKINYVVEKIQEKVLGVVHPATLTTKMNIAKCLSEQGKNEEALKINLDLEKNMETVLGPLHSTTLMTKMNIAACLTKQGKNEEALEMSYALEKDMELALGPLHPTTLATKTNIAAILTEQGNIEEALRMNYILEKSMESALGPLHPTSLLTRMNIGTCLMFQGKNEEALQINLDLENNMEKALGLLHHDTLKTKMNIATCVYNLGKNDEALRLYSILEKDQEKVLGPLHPHSLLLKMNKASALLNVGRTEEALDLYFFVEKDMEKVLGPLHLYTLATKLNIAECLCEQGKYQEAWKVILVVEKDGEKYLGPLHPNVLECKSKIQMCLEKIGKEEKEL